MFRPLSVFIGLRYTAAKRRNHFISFISLVSMLGLILGVMVLITVLSVMNGFDRELKQRILGMVPHAVVESREGLDDWRSVADIAAQDPDVVGVAPYTQAKGMVTGRGQVQGVMINGIHPQKEVDVSIIQNHMVTGSLANLESGSFQIIIGTSLARRLGVGQGDRVTLVLPEASVSPAGVLPRLKRFTVAGTFSVGAELDSSYTLVHYQDAAKLLRLGDKAQGIRIKVNDLFKAPMVADRIAQELPGNRYRTTNWTHTHGNLFEAIRMEKTMIGLLLMFIVAVAAFNIVSALVMVVTDKKADIAILRTMGMTPRGIMGVFMVQGAVIGVGGTIIGTLLGIALAMNVSGVIEWVESVLSMQFLSADVYFISYLPSELQWNDVMIVGGAGLVMSLLATIYPAWRASRVQPAEALRYE
ncbi:lipoprotein-releasing system permease protein [Halospina denitrificans]|uniref:Lipoprotein-releasing system permease protein n=1 Tax=Halospina denitrificans TaxID=332522 RepID=A0A4R7JQH9_9GAMM|nr:lipoprotein-releasing ABC transporter permease subunit [Halospina denitrificans]TDT39443.1 lipoprotein-releasing system permease protein [Halospina denitrificans]